MTVIAVTGNLGAGKTTVSQMFVGLGASLIDADVIAHQLLDGNRSCQRKVRAAFGPDIFEDGCISRKKIAAKVFEDEQSLKILEAIIHPLVRKEIQKQLSQFRRAKNDRIVILEIPLLFETGMEIFADAVVAVRSNRKLQIERIVKKRKMTSREAMARLKHQMSQQEKLKRADFVVDNRLSRKNTRAQVRRIFDALVYNK